MPRPAIVFRRVGYQVNGRAILRNLDFQVNQGETFVLLGRSGCGKTTTLRLVNRLIRCSEGEVEVQGRSVAAWDPIELRRSIGYVIQEVGLFPHFTIRRNVGLVPSLLGWDPGRVRDRVDEMLQLVGMDPQAFACRYPAELSGGQRQRVGVARALAADPPILLMDEPFGALDPITRGEVQEEFQALKERLRKTILFVTHDLREALILGNRIGLMEGGRLVFAGTPQQLLHSPVPQVEAFLRPLRRFQSQA